MKNEEYNELAYYTLAHQSQDFIHQNMVDAYTAQMADEKTKPIAIVYALAGLYLYLIKKYTSKQVQQAHVIMSASSKIFEPITLPEKKGDLTIKEVLEKAPGAERDQMIHRWCQSVWDAYASEHHKVILITTQLLQKENDRLEKQTRFTK